MNKQRLFVASCVSLLTTSMVFAIRADIAGDLSGAFHLTNEQLGLIWGPALWGFTIAIFICGALVDALGMRLLHALSAVGYIAGVGLVLAAPAPSGPVASVFGTTGTTMLYIGFLLMGLSQGIVEGVINPLIATLYSDEKTKKLNILHAWWPGGMIIGGLLAYFLGRGTSWQVKLATILIPSVIYLVMVATLKYPKTERAQSNVPTSEMVKQSFNPLFLLLFACMWLTAATELGPDQWFAKMLTDITGLQGILFLVYTAGLMFVLRFFFSGFVHKFSPFGVMTICSVLSALGLYWLGSLQPGSSAAIAFVAATVFGLGKTFYWPTMLGVTAERFPKGGGLLINLMGGAGMLAVAVALPLIGSALDSKGAGPAMQVTAILPVILTVVFGALYAGFRAKGGYKVVKLGAEEAPRNAE